MPEILSLVGLTDKMNSLPHEISGGEQQRVSIARAFVNHPPLLLADEPTGNLDPETSIGIMQLLERINRTGTTVAGRHPRPRHGQPHAQARLPLDGGRLVRDEQRGFYDEHAGGARRGGGPGENGLLLQRGPRLAAPQLGHDPGGRAHGVHRHGHPGPGAGHNRNLNPGATSLKNRVMIEVFISDNATRAGQALQAKIRRMPQVKSYQYISKAQALKEFRKRLGASADQSSPTCVGNPLPASYASG